MTASLEPSFSFWTDLASPLVFSAAGAMISLFLKDQYDKRQTKFGYGVDDIQFLCEQVNLAREAALDYWSKNAKDDTVLLAARIIGHLHCCAELISSTNLGNDADRKTLQAELSKFRNVCTSGNFGDADRQMELERLPNIEIEGRVLVAKMLSFKRR